MPSVDAVRNNIRRVGIDTGYVLLGLPLAIAAFVVVVTGLSAGLGLLITVIGVPVLAATLLAARLFADIERLRIPAVLNRPRVRPTFRAAQAGAGVWKRMVTPITQIQFWLDAAHAVLQFPVAVATFTVVVSWWSVAIAGTLTVAWDWSIPRGPDNRSLAQLIGLGDSTFARIGLQTALGLLGLVTLPFVVRGCAWISAAFSRLLLTGVAEMRGYHRRAHRAEGGRRRGRGGGAAPAGARHPRRPPAAAGAAGDGPAAAPSGRLDSDPERPAARWTRRSTRPARRWTSCARCPAASPRRCSPTAGCRARWPRSPAGAPSRSSWPSTLADRQTGSARRWRTPRTSWSPRR